MREIPLTQGYCALVDDEDYERINAFKWYAVKRLWKCSIGVYAIRNSTRPDGSRSTIRMHQEISGCKNPDHIYRNGLNNQRANLRPATPLQNAVNVAPRQGTSSVFKGVSWHKDANKWAAAIRINKKSVHIGLFVDEVDAATAYNLIAYGLHGEFAFLNTPSLRMAA